jgi:elongation factor Ts
MAEITPALVKALRERTGAGMNDCKKALSESAGDMEAAIDWLRKKGLSAAAKKSGRVAAEGLIGVASAPLRAAMVEVNAETDFVARNDAFQDFVEQIAKIALEVGDDLDAIRAAPYPGTSRSVAEELTQQVATIGENMNIRRAKVLTVPRGVVATYVHKAERAGLGKIGVLVAIEGDSELDALELLGRQVGMHVAAARPEALDIDAVDPAALERERAVLSEQARQSGKSEDIIAKMVDGRIRKYYEEVVLLEQVWVHDGESRVRAVLKKSGGRLRGFARFQLCEGIEKAATDFAAEVAAAAGVKKETPNEEPSTKQPPPEPSPPGPV